MESTSFKSLELKDTRMTFDDVSKHHRPIKLVIKITTDNGKTIRYCKHETKASATKNLAKPMNGIPLNLSNLKDIMMLFKLQKRNVPMG